MSLVPLQGAGCSSVIEHLLGHRKGFCRAAEWLRKHFLQPGSLLIYPVSLLFSSCPYSSFLPLPLPHFPFLVSSSHPLCLPVLPIPFHFLYPPFWPLISLFPSPKDTMEEVKGDTTPLTHQSVSFHKFLFWSLLQGRTYYCSQTHTGIVECFYSTVFQMKARP